MKHFLTKTYIKLHKFFEDTSYSYVSNDKYYEKFGIINKNGHYDFKEEKERIKVQEAYNKACHNRDFEIEKFWSRAAYFWGFIVLIFTGYFTILTVDNDVQNRLDNLYRLIVISLNCAGFLFSVAWYFVIIGSKFWQENWEAHIDFLEDFVTGPLFKTIHFKRDFYSVTRVNKFLAIIVILFWVGLLLVFLDTYNYFPWNKGASCKVDFIVTSPILVTIFLSISMWYANKKSFSAKKGFIRRESPKPDKKVEGEIENTPN